MLVICDSREPDDIQQQLKEKFPSLQIASLGESSGDLFAQLENGNLIIERKKCPSDLLGSISDSRIFAQSSSIPMLARFCFLLIDGELRYSHNDRVMMTRQGGFVETNWSKPSIEMALFRCSWLGMEVIRDDHPLVLSCTSYADKVDAIIKWCEQDADRLHSNGKLNRLMVNPFDPDEARRQSIINFFSAFPGIGAEKAVKEIAEDWKSLRVVDLFLRFVNQSKQAKPTRRLLELAEGETLHVRQTESKK